jgi:Pectate lyase superfamily protein
MMKRLGILFLFLALVGFMGAAPLVMAQSLADFGGVGDGITDNSAALDAAVRSVCAGPSRTLHVPAGVFNFTRAPAPFTCAIQLVGEGRGATILARDYSGAPYYFLNWRQYETDNGGGALRDLIVATTPRGTDGIAVWVLAQFENAPTTLSHNPHHFLIDNVTIGRLVVAGSWSIGVYLDGYWNIGGAPGTEPGIRDINIRNTTVSGHLIGAFYLNRAFGVQMSSVDCYIGPAIIYADGSQGLDIHTRTCQVSLFNGSAP